MPEEPVSLPDSSDDDRRSVFRYWEPAALALNGGSSQVPNWLRWATAAVIQVGIPGAIAMFLVWVGAQQLPRISNAVEATNVRVMALERQQAEAEGRMAEVYRMLQRICSNTARNDDERGRCFDK